MHLPTLISDLALMLLTAGVVTVLFRKLNQPLVLGYIVAGFLISPYVGFFPTVMDTHSIETWKEIGIIILMFYLGLEFNLHKLAKVGGTGFITAMVEVLGMLLLGFAAGRLMGWSVMDSVFLGGMLSMSSTTIIIKAFEELNMMKKPYTGLVFGTLVIEDIAGIFMMIVLSTISVSRNISGLDLALTILMLMLYLAIWLILGIYVLPTLLNKAQKLMNDETLLVVSLGICFGMVLLADALGFSSALGAFLAGSLLAGTVHAERVEHLTKGVKDLFGSVFFISVGMMVDPAQLAEHWLPILIISLLTIFGKLFFSTFGMLLSGQPLENAVRSGFSLAQIGEFAFIIASLGLSLGVIGDFMYPIVVTVSVITTFTTPFCIKFSDTAVPWLEKHLPDKVLTYLSRHTDGKQTEKEQDGEWVAFFKRYFFVTAFYGVLMFGLTIMGTKLLHPWLAGMEMMPAWAANIISLAVIYIFLALFVRPMLDPRNKTFTALWVKGPSFQLPLLALTGLRICFIVFLLTLPMQMILPVQYLWLIPVLLGFVLLISGSKRLSTYYLKVETRFLANFNERLLHRDQSDSVEWLDEQLHVGCFSTGDYGGKTLKELGWGRRYGVNVIRIRRGKKFILIPGGDEKIMGGDQVWLLGDQQALNNFWQGSGISPGCAGKTLREFVAVEEEGNASLYCCAVEAVADAPFVNRTVRDSAIRQDLDCVMLGLQKKGYPVIDPPVDMMIDQGDFIWVLGGGSMITKLAQLGLVTEEKVEELAAGVETVENGQ